MIQEPKPEGVDQHLHTFAVNARELEAAAKPSILDDEEMQNAINSREIRQDDFPLLEQLAECDRQELIAIYHNFFSGMTRYEDPKLEFVKRIDNEIENTQRRLDEKKSSDQDRLVDTLQKRLKLHTLMRELVDRYDTYVAVHIERVLESWRP